MEFSCDSYDWVMIGNVYGMGYFNTNTMRKPYISTSNYIRKNHWKVNVPSDNKEDNVNFRYRQRQPDKFIQKTFRHKKINSYTSFIIGELKD